MIRNIDNYESINKLAQLNFNDPYIVRKFKTSEKEVFRYLVESYIDSFAFSIIYKKNKYSVLKKGNATYVRNDNKRQFEFPNCPPPVINNYDIKSDNLCEIIKYIEGGN